MFRIVLPYERKLQTFLVPDVKFNKLCDTVLDNFVFACFFLCFTFATICWLESEPIYAIRKLIEQAINVDERKNWVEVFASTIEFKLFVEHSIHAEGTAPNRLFSWMMFEIEKERFWVCVCVRVFEWKKRATVSAAYYRWEKHYTVQAPKLKACVAHVFSTCLRLCYRTNRIFASKWITRLWYES